MTKIIIQTPGVQGRQGGGSGAAVEQLVVEATGEWKSSFSAFAVAPGVLSFYPSEVHVTGDGCWLQEFYFEEDTETGLTSIAFPNLVGTIRDFELEYFADLTTVDMPEFLVSGAYLEFYSLGTCTAINLPKLRAVGGDLRVSYCNALPEFVAPELEFLDEFDCYYNASLETVSFPSLLVTGDFYVSQNESLTTLSMPLLRDIRRYFEVRECPGIQSIIFESLERIGYVGLGWGAGHITSFSYGPNLIEARSDQYFDSCTLDEGSVDGILTALAALDGTGGTVEFRDRYVSIGGNNAAPSAAGLAAAQVLTDRDCYVTYNT